MVAVVERVRKVIQSLEVVEQAARLPEQVIPVLLKVVRIAYGLLSKAKIMALL